MNNLFEHRDFYLGAYLMTCGFKLVCHERHRGVTSFYFENNEELENHVNDYYSLKGSVDPLTYSSAIRSLKTIIHSSRSTAKSENLNNENNNKLQERI
jgi:hypothetical protein